MTNKPNDSVVTNDGAVTLDSFVNFAHNLGIGSDNPMTSSTYGFNPVTRNRTLLEWIHRGSWIGGIAVDCVADDMTRSGVSIYGEIDPDDITRIEEEVVGLNIWGAINETIKWSRLYGGAIAVLLIDGQDPETPLRLNTIRKDQFCGLLSLDRWMVEPSLHDLVTDYGPSLGLPKYYRVTAQAPALSGQKIHYSRCIRLEGVKLPYWQRLMENGWGLSVLERLYDRMIAFDSATTGAAQLIYKAYLRTFGIKDLREIVAAGGDALIGLTKYVDMMRRFQGIEGITLIDSEDTFNAESHSAFSGISDSLIQFGQQLSGALQIPLVRLFGQSPAGFSTGDSDLRNYYDTIKQQQEFALRVPMTKVYRAIAASNGINIGKGFKIEFNNLWQLTDNEKGDIGNKIFDVVSRAEEGGLIDKATALKELKQSSRLTGIFTNITDKMVTEAEGELPPLPEEMPVGEVKQEERLQELNLNRQPEPSLFKPAPYSDAKIKAAGICMISDKGRILLLRRSPSAIDHVGEWAFPGGHIKGEEFPIEAAVREFQEETGITPVEYYLKPESGVTLNNFIGYPTKNVDENKIKVQLNNESDQFIWCSLNELPQPMHTDSLLLIRKLYR